MKNLGYTLLAILQIALLFIIQVIGIVIGYPLVAIGLFFTTVDERTRKPFEVTNNSWVRESLPKWLWPWDNQEDSCRGDHPGRWDRDCFGADSVRYLNKFWWLAVRNPFNNFKRLIIGCDVRNYVMSLLAGQIYVRDDLRSTGWQFIIARPKKDSGKWFPRFHFYLVHQWGDSTRALVIELGNKVRTDHNNAVEADEIDYFKGFTFEVNPYKDIS